MVREFPVAAALRRGGETSRPMTHTFRLATAASLSCVLAGALLASTPAGLSAAGASCEDLRTDDHRRWPNRLGSNPSAPACSCPRTQETAAGPIRSRSCRRSVGSQQPSHPADSDIKIEVWIPSRLEARSRPTVTGDGPDLNYPAMAEALGQGICDRSTDTGHTGAAGASRSDIRKS